jgi:integrase
MSGNITRRGAHSWRLKFEAGEPDLLTGKRQTRYVTVRGTKKDAQRELTRLLAEIENGTAVDPSRVTVAEYLRDWLDRGEGLSPKTLERYRQLAERQIVPHLGSVPLQKLRPAQIHDWHGTLSKAGGAEGRPLSTRTVGHAHRVLHRALERAMRLEIVNRNVAHPVPPPKVEDVEVEILTAEQITEVLAKLDGYGGRYGALPLHPIAAMALGTGMRRGELCGLAWGALDLDAAVVRVERSLEETREGLRLKTPKTRAGRRAISLPASAVDILRGHRRRLIERRLALGLGRLGAEDLVFSMPDGSPYSPDKLSRDWGHAVRDRKLPAVNFHALRHSHASALIAAGLDIVTISRRLGHGSPAVTLRVYAHIFSAGKDEAAALAIDAAMGAKSPT